MSPRISTSKKEENRRMIAKKALQAFKEHGYHGTSMNIISCYTLISICGIYGYCKSKEVHFIYILDYVLNKIPYFLKTVSKDRKAYDRLLDQSHRITFSWDDLDNNSTLL